MRGGPDHARVRASEWGSRCVLGEITAINYLRNNDHINNNQWTWSDTFVQDGQSEVGLGQGDGFPSTTLEAS